MNVAHAYNQANTVEVCQRHYDVGTVPGFGPLGPVLDARHRGCVVCTAESDAKRYFQGSALRDGRMQSPPAAGFVPRTHSYACRECGRTDVLHPTKGADGVAACPDHPDAVIDSIPEP